MTICVVKCIVSKLNAIATVFLNN